MKITDWKENKQPLETVSGEIVYELVGKAADDGINPNHSLARIVIPPGKSSSLHFHKVTEETYFILQGEGHMEINQQNFTLLPGQACLIEVEEIHRIKNDGEGDLVFLAFCAPAWVPEDSFEV